MKIRASTPSSYAIGFPTTCAVSTRRLRSTGNLLVRRGDIVLANGTNTFIVEADALRSFRRISVQPEEAGAYALVGHESLDVGSTGKVLARFGSEQAARNGYAAVMKSYSGVKIAHSGGSRLKWACAMVGLVVATFLVLAAVIPVDSAAVAVGELNSGGTAVPQLAKNGFDPNEPSLEALASGNYQFRPQLKAPVVAAPALNCDPTGG